MSENVIISLIAALASTVTALGMGWIGFKIAVIRQENKELHNQINSRMDEYIEAIKKNSKREGANEERENPTTK